MEELYIEKDKQWIKDKLDLYFCGACSQLSSELGSRSDKRLISLNRIMYTHYGNVDTHDVLTAISDIYMYVETIIKNSRDQNTGAIDDVKKRLKSNPDSLYFLCMVFDVIGWPNVFVQSEFNILRHNTPSTTKVECLLLSAERIIRLHRLLIDEGIIEQINTGDFIKCFDINNKPLIRPTVTQGSGARYVCFLSLIPGMKESIAYSHFNQKRYDKTKSEIYIDDFIKGAHERLHKRCAIIIDK